MNRACAAGRQAFALGAVFACLLALSPSAYALNPALDISQYAHASWKIRDGFSNGYITAFAQTSDGYLWLGTEFGLLRFDGVRNVVWQPPAGQSLPSNYIRKLLASRDGTLWIGTLKGLASWKDGRLTAYPKLAGQNVNAFVEDREGTVWIGAQAFPNGKLCAFKIGSVQCYADDGSLGQGVMSLYEQKAGTLWVGAETGLWRWRPGPKRQTLSGTLDTLDNLAEDDDGALLIGTSAGIRRLAETQETAYRISGPAIQLRATRLLHDRDGGLWIGTTDRGLLHVHQGRTDVFAQPDGLSGNFINRLFEDREGNIWIATLDGLDRFRDLAIPTIASGQGLPNGAGSVEVAGDGSIWISTRGGLSRLKDGHLTTIRRGQMESLFRGDDGRMWVSAPDEVGYFEKDRFVPIRGAPRGHTYSIVEDVAGTVWIANREEGLVHVSPSHGVQQIPWTTLGHTDPALAVVADRSRGGLWIGFFSGGVAYFRDGEIRASYAHGDGLGEGTVYGFQLDQDGTLWAATEGGLSRLKDGRVATLSSKSGLPCDAVHWLIEDDTHAVWLYMGCGLVRIPRFELDAWGRNPATTVHPTILDGSDGVRLHGVGVSTYSPLVTRSSDGRLWFVSGDGVSVIDPRHLLINSLAPPVHIEQITADRQTYETSSRVRLPPLVRDLVIDYTALSLVAPEKNRFKIKLEGWDRDWQDVGNRRQAFYNNLPPRNYRFRVIASNNSGVWNETGASLDFAIAPAYYQTRWFQALIAFAGLTLLWAAYQVRVRRIAREFDMRLDERVNERTRVARELHDTLLQTFHGVLFRFQAAVNMLPERPAEAKKTFESAIDRAAQAITEGRDAIQDLRASTVVTNDLAEAISTLGDELAASAANGNGTVVHVAVEGTSRDLHPILRDDIYRIAGEALRNAFRHAHARRIEVEMTYDDRQFRLQVRDDGKGMDPAVLADQRRGHFGLPGMRERAELVGGRLDVWSEVGVGTEVDLTIPAAKAYAEARARRRAWWFAKKTGAA